MIFDDSAELFNASYKISFWKFALEDNIKKAVVELSQAVGSDEKIGDNIYVPGDLTRQERYYVEVGSSTPKEKADFDKANRPGLVKKYLQKNTHILSAGDLTASDDLVIDQMLKREWKKHEETKKPKMPNRFNFKGLVIVISNKERDKFKEEVGGKDKISRSSIEFITKYIERMTIKDERKNNTRRNSKKNKITANKKQRNSK